MITLPKQTKWWRIPNLKTPSFKDILFWCRETQKVDKLLVSVRPLINNKDEFEFEQSVIKNVYRLFGSNILDRIEAVGWPGNLLTRGFAYIFIIEYNTDVENIILDKETLLFHWLHDHRQKLPEDLCLFKNGNTYPSLISITHENDAWLLSGDNTPPLPTLKSEVIKESFIFEKPWFCKKNQ
ncbi:MAG: hypothetical protein PVG39_31765 [Desulfobacteraceae bacterium]|jgi:hypothetical protein